MNNLYRDPTQPISARITNLLTQMSLTEKVGQLCMDPMLEFKQHQEKYYDLIRQGKCGSRILADTAWAGNAPAEIIDPVELNQIQRVAVEESRLGIPIIFARDVIYGQATVLPIPLAQAASWDPNCVSEAYRDIAREASSLGIHWTFAPMLDIARDPRWGRVIETFGEDPYLTSQFAKAVVTGFQGTDVSQPDSLLACAKHFVGYAAVEGGRDYDTTELSQNTLHNVHLPPFAAAIEAGVGSIMTGFCDLGGTPVSASKPLIRHWLKSQQNFNGLVVSDWGSISDLAYFGIATDATDAAKQALNAGIDMAMTNEAYEGHLEKLVDNQEIDISLIDDAVYRILYAKFSCGLFENPYVDESRHLTALRHPEHIKRAQTLAEKCIVMLKNGNNILPINSANKQTIAVIGPHAHSQRQHLGSWCLDGNADDVTSIYQGIKNSANNCNVITDNSEFSDEMVECAHRADIVVLCVGESHRRTGEARNIAQLQLPPGQEELINAIGETGKPLIIVQCTGRPIPSKAIEHYGDALLMSWQLGTETGNSVANILFGHTNPSGKLPITVPRTTGQIPIYYGRKQLGKMRAYQEYQPYKDTSDTPLYPFGFGLSYTQFSYSQPKLKYAELTQDKQQQVSVTISNIGKSTGIEIVQCYIRQCTASTSRPLRELKGFQRITLAPGEAKDVTFTLTSKELSFFNIEGVITTEPSEIIVYIGNDSNTENKAIFSLV
ncbi:glycoside hydrolase family 3 N-terminal domain-containing protein [Proteus hauseri]|uniref:glycoside hydrolase family 3 N-terminal domain-containing protein n=1 Tax=Proteus hauseri TaxID=183417 RepID=UPI0032DAD7D1